MKKKIFIVQMLDSKNPSGKSFTQVNDALFYSNDTDAHLVFLPHEQERFEFNEATVALYNIDDESLVERPATIETFEGRKSVVLKMTEDLLAHWGRWQAQVVFKQGDKINTSVVVKFDTLRYMLDQRPPTLRDVIKVDELYSQLVTVMDEIAGKDVISAPEIILARAGFDTLGERLNDTNVQLAQKVDKGNVSVSDINKNLGKLDQTFMSDGFLQQMAGNTPVNAVPADGSLTTPKYADKSVTTDKMSDDTWVSVNSQLALKTLEEDSSQFNVLKFDSYSRRLDGVSNTTISDGVYTVSGGGFYFITEKVGVNDKIQAGDVVSVALKVDNASSDALFEFEARHGADRLFLRNLVYAGSGWYILEDIEIPTNTEDVRLRVDNRAQSVSVTVSNFVLQKYDRLMPTVDGLNKEASVLTDKVTSIESKVGLKRYIPYNFPQDFRWKDNPLNGHIFTDGEGGFEVVGFDVSSYKPVGKYYYVDYNNGDDTNDGLSLETAFRTVGKAKSMTDSVGAYLAEGLYPRTVTLLNDPITKPFALVAVEGHEVWYTSHSYSIFAPVSSMPGVYHATRSGVGPFVADTKYSVDGIPYDLKQLSRASEVASEPGSYAFVVDKLFVHLIDGREPDADVILSSSGNLTVVQGGNDLYLEGINFIGGQSPLHVQNTSTGLRPRVFAKDCNFMYSGTENNDVVMLQGVDLSIFQNCKAGRGLKDGFNYHWRNNIAPKSIEINCQGFENGNIEDNNDQGSTTHDGGSIIRINGAYYRNLGANIAEDATVGDNPTESLNLGCVGFESVSPIPTRAVNFDCYHGVNMWLDGCVGYGSPYNVRRDIKIRNSNFTGVLHPEGEEPTYY